MSGHYCLDDNNSRCKVSLKNLRRLQLKYTCNIQVVLNAYAANINWYLPWPSVSVSVLKFTVELFPFLCLGLGYWADLFFF